MQELDALDKVILQAYQNLEVYQTKMFRAFNHTTLPRAFEGRELVLGLRRPIISNRKIGGNLS